MIFVASQWILWSTSWCPSCWWHELQCLLCWWWYWYGSGMISIIRFFGNVYFSQSTTKLLIMLKWVTRKLNHINHKSQRILQLSFDGLANHHVNHFNFDSGDQCSCWFQHLACFTCGISAPGLVWRIPTMSRLKTLENSNNNFPPLFIDINCTGWYLL